MNSCSDGDDGTPKTKRLTKIKKLNGDHEKFIYNPDRRLISVEDGDEDELHEKVTVVYDGQSISKILIFNLELFATQNFTYKEDSVSYPVRISLEWNVNGSLIINTSFGDFTEIFM